MDLLKFQDSCVIVRPSGEYNEFDEPMNDVTIYSGACMFQRGPQSNDDILHRFDTACLPVNNLDIKPNDIITITTRLDEVINGAVNIARRIELPITGDRYTNIEIKQSYEQ